MIVINLSTATLTSSGGRNIYGSWAGGDYSCFYVAGKLLNEYSPDKLYDFRLQNELLHSLLPKISLNKQLPYLNAPFFALIFKPLSRLPFMASYFSWILVSVILFIIGFKLFLKTLRSIPQKSSNVALLLALSFEPFLMESIFGGNSSAIAFFSFALFLYFLHFKREILSGLSLGILLYKPTLLIIILPMIFIARKIKIFLGFLISCIGMMLLSILTVGFDTFFQYIRFLIGVSGSTLRSEVIFPIWKYVDIFSFSQLLLGTISQEILIKIIIISFIPIIFLIRLWHKIDCLNIDNQNLLVASTITMTTIINMHFGIYDTVIIILPIMLTADILYRYSKIQNSEGLNQGFKALLLFIYILPWVSQHMARITGFQLFSFAIAIMGGYQIFLAYTYSAGINGSASVSKRAGMS